jgi:hypothetical protein
MRDWRYVFWRAVSWPRHRLELARLRRRKEQA